MREKSSTRPSTILIQILRRIIFRHFVLYLALTGIESIFYAQYPLSFQRVPFEQFLHTLRIIRWAIG